MRRTTGILLTGTLAAGTLTLLAAPAEAASRCTTGTWIETSLKETLGGPTTMLTATGGAGTKLIIPSKGKITFDFRKAKKITVKGTYKSEPLARTDQYRGVLRVTGTIKGKRISYRLKTKTGNATLTEWITRPAPGKVGPIKLTQLDGPGDYLNTSSFTCTKKALRLRFKYVTRTNFAATGDLRFRRA